MKKATISVLMLGLVVMLAAYTSADTASAASDQATIDDQLTVTTVSTTATLSVTTDAQGGQLISHNQPGPPRGCFLNTPGGRFRIPQFICSVIGFG